MLHMMLFERGNRQPQAARLAQAPLRPLAGRTGEDSQVGEDHPDREEEPGQDSLERPLLVAHDRVGHIGPVLA